MSALAVVVRDALKHLRIARDLLVNAPKAQERVRLAIKSCEGAARHAELEPQRAERQAREVLS